MFEFPRGFIIYTNYFLVIWLLVALYRGYKRGFLLQLVDFVGTIVALFGAWLFSEPFARVFSFIKIKGNGYASIDQLVNFQVNRLLWVVLLFIGIRVALLVIRPLASFISKMPLIKQVNSSIGGVVSIVLYFVKLVILVFFLSFPVVKNGADIVDGSFLKYVSDASIPAFNLIQETVDKNEAIQSILSNKSLTPEQTDAMVEWLLSQGFSSNDIQEYLNTNE